MSYVISRGCHFVKMFCCFWITAGHHMHYPRDGTSCAANCQSNSQFHSSPGNATSVHRSVWSRPYFEIKVMYPVIENHILTEFLTGLCQLVCVMAYGIGTNYDQTKDSCTSWFYGFSFGWAMVSCILHFLNTSMSLLEVAARNISIL